MSAIEHTGTQEPAAGCGQQAPATGCGQSAPAAGCGQQATPPPPTSGGQRAPEDACGQDSAPSSCGQDTIEATSSTCGADPQRGRYLDSLEMGAWRAFLTASTTVTARLNHELESGAGVSMHEYEILVRLSEAEGRTLRMSALAENVAHSRSRLTHTVSRLEKVGYVRRTACPMDKRGVNCHLTQEGEEFLRTAAPIHLDGVRRHVIDHLDRGQLADLTVLLRALVEPGDAED